MANTEQPKILKQGVENWNKWREENPDEKVDLRNANLFKADLSRADLSGAILRDAILVEANLIDKASRSRTIEEWQNGPSN
jgi:hypothetical protein